MARKMICVDNPTHYHNQLQFNLDAQSPASTASHTYGRPKYLLIEKVQKHVPKVRVLSPENKFGVMASDKLSLAIQLAKMDVSNSQWNNNEIPVKDTTKPSVKAKQHQQHFDERFVKKVQVQMPGNYARAGKINKPKLSKPPKPAPAFRSHRNKQNHIRFQQEPDFEDHIRRIIEPVQQKSKSLPTSKDAVTSTADLSREVESFGHRSEFKNFARELQGVVKKEKLIKRYNQQQPRKSGFLSMHRSPAKRSFRQALSTPLRMSHILTQQKPIEKRQLPTEKVEKAALRDAATSPILRQRPKHQQKKVVRALHNDTSDTDENWVSFTASSGTEDSYFGKTEPKQSGRRRGFRKPETDVIRKQQQKGIKDMLVASILQDIFADTAKEVHKHEHEPKLLQSMANEPTCEAMYKKIEQMEQEETEIRKRWETIQYEDIKPRTRVPRYSRTSSDNTEELRTSSPQPLCFTNREFAKGEEISKPSVRFMQEEPGFNTLYMASTSSIKSSPNSNAIKLSLNRDTAESIRANRTKYNNYLKHTYHEPKGAFNPWKIVQELSEDVMKQVISEVVSELDGLCDDYVEHVFESEFADPSQSLASGVDPSSSFSTISHIVEESSLALSSHISEVSSNTAT
ncbi:uncharacterized protein LOC144742386 [Ciona intestinalis]